MSRRARPAPGTRLAGPALFALLGGLPSPAVRADEAGSGDEAVSVATLEWPPYIGAELPDHGLWGQLLTESFGLSGRTVEFEFLPWTRALSQVRSGGLDVVLPAYRTQERTGIYWLSAPVPGSPVGMVARTADRVEFEDVRELKGRRLGLVRDYVNVPAIDAEAGWVTDETRTDQLNLKKLAHGRVDVVFVDWAVAAWVERERLPGGADIEPVGPPLKNPSLHALFSRATPDGEALRDAFDEGLRELERSGRLAELFTRHGFAAPPAGLYGAPAPPYAGPSGSTAGEDAEAVGD